MRRIDIGLSSQTLDCVLQLDEMDSSRLADGPSLAHQRWPHLSPYASPVVGTAGPSQATPHSELALDESARAYRTTALRQLNGNTRPLTRKSRQANSTGSRSSTLVSQPVLVRSYSGNTDRGAESSKMPSRRRSLSSRDQRRAPQLPSAEDFSIEAILRVIEPDIRTTLDSIAEICGRSKLSLANEYGSHIAPFGEIRAPPGGLLTVEEASASHEGELDNNVVIYDDDNSVVDGRDHDSAYYGYFENTGRTTVGNAGDQALPLPTEDVPSAQDPSAPGLPSAGYLSPALNSLPASREVTSKPRSGALLGKTAESAKVNRRQSIQTPAVVSEMHLDARANGPSQPDKGRFLHGHTNTASIPMNHGTPSRPTALGDLRALFAWLTQIWGESDGQPQTAETRLRETLERQASQNVSAAL